MKFALTTPKTCVASAAAADQARAQMIATPAIIEVHLIGRLGAVKAKLRGLANQGVARRIVSTLTARTGSTTADAKDDPEPSVSALARLAKT